LHLVGILFPHINYDAQSQSHQIHSKIVCIKLVHLLTYVYYFMFETALVTVILKNRSVLRTLLGLLNPTNKGTSILLDVCKYSPLEAA